MAFAKEPLKNTAFYCNNNACPPQKYLFQEISIAYMNENETFFLNDNEILMIGA